MKIVFCSNYMNHHQLELSQSFLELGVDYKFIAGQSIDYARLALGYEDMNSKYDWIVKAYNDINSKRLARKLINEADLVILGSYPLLRVYGRILKNKPVFLYNERFYKRNDGNLDKIKNPKTYLVHLLRRKLLNYFNVYMLCASAYTAYDCSVYGDFIDKCYKWGYFPKTYNYDIKQLISYKEENEKIKILWVGRFLDWKHPEYMIELAKYLNQLNYKYEIEMIGNGPKFDSIKKQIDINNLGSNITMLGSMPFVDVRKKMEQANIFAFTSDFGEGWGAVLNEAMNSGCAVVASHAIGAVPFLLQNDYNGKIYKFGLIDEFCKCVVSLIDDKSKRMQIAENAYRTIYDEWNAKQAAKRVMLLYKKIILKQDVVIDEGVCSKANIITNNWM